MGLDVGDVGKALGCTLGYILRGRSTYILARIFVVSNAFDKPEY